MMTAAKNLRADLKRLGYTARMVSVRVRDLTVSDAIDVVIKTADVDAARIIELTNAAARVDRCELTGDVLGGGNLYTRVTWAPGVIETAAADFIAALKRGESATWLGWTAAPVEGRSDFFSAAPEGTTPMGNRAPIYCCGASFCARQIAEKA